MVLIYYDPLFLEHHTGNHPENAQRLRSVVSRLQTTGWLERCQRPDWAPASIQQVARVHQPEYVERVRKYVERGGGQIEADTVTSSRSLDAALLASGAVCDAVARVVSGEDRRALCLVRPPGHHALADAPMGFCLLNSVAIGARSALADHRLERVLIVDWDVHHGNGTQDAFWEVERVGFLSIHRWPFYPGTGSADQTGSGPGLGATLNLPVAFGTSRKAYLNGFRRGLEQLATAIRPDLLLISAGFDSHRTDPIGSLGLEVEDFADLTEAVVEVANAYCAGRIVSVLEGGYDPEVLSECVEIHLQTLAGRRQPS